MFYRMRFVFLAVDGGIKVFCQSQVVLRLVFMKCTKVWAFLKLVYANQRSAVVVVVLVVVVGGFRIRFGSGCLEPMSKTPPPVCFTSRCSSREWARPTGFTRKSRVLETLRFSPETASVCRVFLKSNCHFSIITLVINSLLSI